MKLKISVTLIDITKQKLLYQKSHLQMSLNRLKYTRTRFSDVCNSIGGLLNSIFKYICYSSELHVQLWLEIYLIQITEISKTIQAMFNANWW